MVGRRPSHSGRLRWGRGLAVVERRQRVGDRHRGGRLVDAGAVEGAGAVLVFEEGEEEVLGAVSIMEDVLRTRSWDKPEYHRKGLVT